MSPVKRPSVTWLKRLKRLKADTARIVAEDEAELKRIERRLHVHLGVLVLAVILVNVCYAMDWGEQAMLGVSWALSGSQELIDYRRRF